jgi:DNA mismatch repair protein PMS2|tara:strand:- start:166 stop:2739 length:2574 start_codon:yes stop_codon:yes gene_type:complete
MPPDDDDDDGNGDDVLARPRAIRPIDAAAVHRICSGQVVLDLASCVKELVENALDAGATNVEIRLKDHGTDVVEVSDNGSGVDGASYGMLTKKYATSKLRAFEDLETTTTFGFRGEALSSMCGICGEFTVTTRTLDDGCGTKIEYDAEGNVVSTSAVPRSVGTTATARRLFEPLAVRRKEFLRNAKREYGKALAVVQAYALMSKSVRILCTHQSGKYGRANVLHTRGGSEATVRENVVTVFGAKMMACMREVDFELGSSTGCRVVGFVSKVDPGCGRVGTDRQFFYVNGRPVDLPKMSKALNETYRSFNPNQVPMAVLDFRLPTDSYDVNVTPDKRKVMLHCEQEILMRMKEALAETFAPSRYTFAVGDAPPSAGRRSLSSARRSSDVDDVDDDENDENDDDENWTPIKYGEEETFDAALPIEDFARARAAKRAAPVREVETQKNLETFGFTREVTNVAIGGGWTMATSTENAAPETSPSEAPLATPREVEIKEETEDVEVCEEEEPKRPRLEEPMCEDDDEDVEAPTRPYVGHEEVTFEDVAVTEMEQETPPPSRRESLDVGKIAFSMESMLLRRQNAKKSALPAPTAKEASFESSRIPSETESTVDAASTQTAAKATNELERVFDKADFAKMRIVGQFNLGFILATLGDDLFIIDQHASDEIYNFERLQRTTSLTKQPLIQPISLDLTASEEQTVLQNMPVFLANGFGFCDIAESVPGADINNSSVDPRCRTLRLNAVPFLKNVQFDKSDVQELVAMLDQGQHSLPSKSQLSIGLARPSSGAASDAASARLLRPSKTRAALAMRACRSSIMIGDALDRRSMRRVLNHLTSLEAPWNCPHGRPTMRHVRRWRVRRE